MPSISEVISGVERRLSSRRVAAERRDSGRTDPAPRRSQLRRKTDVVEFLGVPRKSSVSDPPPVRLTPKRPLKRWVEDGLNRDTRGLFS
jgi:hypothetical protein